MMKLSRLCSATRQLRSCRFLALVIILVAQILVFAGPAVAATTVTDVAAFLAPATAQPYGIGVTVEIQVTFSGTVTATGFPKLALNSGGTANYFGPGSTSNQLLFFYVIGTGQNTAHLDYTSSSALTLNGGTILDSAGNPAVLTLPAPGAAGSIGANGSIAINTNGVCRLPFLPAAVEYVISDKRIVEFDRWGGLLVQFGGPGSGPGQFQLPSGIAATNNGVVFVTDAVLNRVQEFDSCGHLLLQFGSTGSAPGLLNRPYGIAVDIGGNIWVADTGNNRIQVFNFAGTFLTQFGGLGGGDGQFNAPVGIALTPDMLWVADTGNNRIQQFNITYPRGPVGGPVPPPTLAFNLKFGSYGSGNGQLNGPFGIVIGANVLVADSFNHRIQQFTAAGSFVQIFGGPFSYPSPFGIAVGLWAVDYNTNTVTLFSDTGAVILSFGVTGGGPGQLFHPTYIAAALNASPV